MSISVVSAPGEPVRIRVSKPRYRWNWRAKCWVDNQRDGWIWQCNRWLKVAPYEPKTC